MSYQTFTERLFAANTEVAAAEAAIATANKRLILAKQEQLYAVKAYRSALGTEPAQS